MKMQIILIFSSWLLNIPLFICATFYITKGAKNVINFEFFIKVVANVDCFRFEWDSAGAQGAFRLSPSGGLLRRPGELSLVLRLSGPHTRRRHSAHRLRVPLSVRSRVQRETAYLRLAVVGRRLRRYRNVPGSLHRWWLPRGTTASLVRPAVRCARLRRKNWKRQRRSCLRFVCNVLFVKLIKSVTTA